MLPSRGILRAAPLLGANSRLPLISRQTTRSFGASVRSSNASFRPRTLPLGPATGSRIGTPLTAVSTTLLFQFRNASTTPSPTPTPPPADPVTTTSETVESIAEKASQVDMSSFQESILDMPEHIGYLKELGLDFGWGPTATMQWVMEHIHVYSGMPWWGTLTVMAILFRGIMFIPSLKAAEMSIKMNAFKSNPDTIRLQQKMRESMEQKKMDEFIRARGELDVLRKVMGISFGPSMLSLLNIPIGFGIFRSVRAMCELPLPAMENGGMLWFPDLSIPDPLYILPAFGAVGLLLMLRVNPAGSPQQMAMMKLMGYVLTPIIFLATLWLPAALQFFFAVSGVLSMFQAWLRLQPWFRNLMGLSYVPSKNRIEADAKKLKWQPPKATALNPAVVPSQPVRQQQQSRSKTATNRALNWMGIRPAIEEFKSTYQQAMIDRTKQNEYNAEKEELDKATDYEKKRREEIQQGLEARVDAARWERMMRREQQKANAATANRRQQARKNSTTSARKQKKHE